MIRPRGHGGIVLSLLLALNSAGIPLSAQQVPVSTVQDLNTALEMLRAAEENQ